MSKRVGHVLAALLVLVIVSTATNSSQATITSSPGVRVGDTACYSLICSGHPDWTMFNLSITGIEGPKVFYDDMFNISITGLSTYRVHYDLIFYYSNGAVADTWQYTSTFGSHEAEMVIPANLTAGDQILYHWNYWFTINKTMTMDVAGTNRSVNYSQFLPVQDGWLYDDIYKADTGYVEAYDVYWDQITGLTVKANMFANLEMSGWSSWFNWTMISLPVNTGAAGIGPDLTAPLLIGGVLAVGLVATAAAVVVKRRKRGAATRLP